MGMRAGNEQEKSQLAKKICEFSARAATCANLHHPLTNRSPFINWYLVLNVDENADICCIRRQYHKLALQLHPDKNSNSKAETAFKLVSEVCILLSLPPLTHSESLLLLHGRHTFGYLTVQEGELLTKRGRALLASDATQVLAAKLILPPTHTKIQTPYQETSRNSRLQTRMRELRSKLQEEATIIEKCLMANAASRREPTNPHETRKESPVFNPSNYQHKSYPHNRTANHKKLEDLREALKMGNRSLHSTANQEYPIFQCRTERVSPMSRCASMRNH